jgi:phospholipid transport system substrate-binding protein
MLISAATLESCFYGLCGIFAKSLKQCHGDHRIGRKTDFFEGENNMQVLKYNNITRASARHCMAFLVLLAAFWAPLQAAKADSQSASNVVQTFQNALIDVMKVADKLSVAQRYDRLNPTVKQTFHIPLMAQISTGNYWAKAAKDERKRLTLAFQRMSVATLATLFDGYSGERFAIDTEKPGPSKTTLVMTSLIKTDKSKINIAYVTRRFRDGWYMIDVIVDNGISELKVRRSEYNLILKKGGVPALIDLLNNKADQLMSQ